MNRTLRLIAVALLAGSIAFWAVAGANRGWTKTHIPKKIVDPTTGLEGVRWQDKFVPGVDFLGVAFLGAGVLTGISFFYRPKPKQLKT